MFEAHYMRDLGARNEILSMRSRMWCRWHVTDKPPQNGTRQEDTMGIHPLNRPQTAQPRERGEGRGEGWRAGCKLVSLHVPSRQACACKEMLKHCQFTTHQCVSGHKY